MEKRSKRMSLVVELARRDEDAAAETFRDALTQLRQSEIKLRELENYYRDYDSRFANSQTRLRASDMSRSRLFLQQLATAMEAQRLQIKKLEQDLQLKRADWHKLYLKHKSLQELQASYLQDELDTQDRLEQKNIDEWVTQRRGGNGGG